MCWCWDVAVAEGYVCVGYVCVQMTEKEKVKIDQRLLRAACCGKQDEVEVTLHVDNSSTFQDWNVG